jgi:Tfp pilus assembly protein PilN
MNGTLNFARRPFRDERPVLLVAGVLLAVAAGLLFVNLRLYTTFQREVAGTSEQINELEKRRASALRESQEARDVLNTYRVSSLAQESRGLLRLVEERRFSWTALLARLERILPAEVRVARLTPHFETNGVTLSLGLVGKDSDSVVRTIAALGRDPVFSVVDLKSESTPEQGVPEGHSFEIETRYAAPEGARGDTAR